MAFGAAARPGHGGPLWLLGLVALLPRVCGQCGAPPNLIRAIPYNIQPEKNFPINTIVQYKCIDNYIKIPGKSDTAVCLSNSQWSNLQEFCDRSCLVPTRFRSAVLSDEDLRKSYYPVGTNVSYVCRPGYESTDPKHFLTCLEDLTWSTAPEFCIAKSCGVPKSPEHGRLVETTNNRYGAKVNIQCDDGYKISGRSFIQCYITRSQDQVEWTKLPTCEYIITPDKPTSIPPGGTRVDDTSSGSAPTTDVNSPVSEVADSLGLGVGIGVSIGTVVVVAAVIAFIVWKKNRSLKHQFPRKCERPVGETKSKLSSERVKINAG